MGEPPNIVKNFYLPYTYSARHLVRASEVHIESNFDLLPPRPFFPRLGWVSGAECGGLNPHGIQFSRWVLSVTSLFIATNPQLSMPGSNPALKRTRQKRRAA